MHDLSIIKSTVTRDPLPFLAALYGDKVRRSGDQWRVGSKGGRCFDTRKGELLCSTFNGDAGAGDCIEVWKAHHGCDFKSAVHQIAELYGVSSESESPRQFTKNTSLPAPAPTMPVAGRPAPWPQLRGRYADLLSDSFYRLASDTSSQERVAEWRGWPVEQIRRLALGMHLGFCEFALWPKVIPPQPAAFFRVRHPTEVVDADGARFWHWHVVQSHIRFLPGGNRCDGGHLSWIYAPSMKALGVTDGGNAPLVLAHFNRDPEQPGWKQHCDTVIFSAGEWDALTVVIAMNWIDPTGILCIPPRLAVVGIRGEGRGGTDSFLRWYSHWDPESAILIADADSTGDSWFSSKDHRPCFAEQLEKKGMRVLARAPKPRDGLKDVNDLYRTGLLHRSHIEEMLDEAGFTTKGGAQ